MTVDETVKLRQSKTEQVRVSGFGDLHPHNLATWIALSEAVAAGATHDQIKEIVCESGLSGQEIVHLAGIWKSLSYDGRPATAALLSIGLDSRHAAGARSSDGD